MPTTRSKTPKALGPRTLLIELRKAGRALDARIAEEVMGWSNVGATQMFTLVADNQSAQFDGVALMGQRPAADERLYPECFETVPAYSTDIAAAWLVVEQLRATGTHGWEVRIDTADRDEWTCQVWSDPEDNPIGSSTAATAPLAICRAALATLSPEVPR